MSNFLLHNSVLLKVIPSHHLKSANQLVDYQRCMSHTLRNINVAKEKKNKPNESEKLE